MLQAVYNAYDKRKRPLRNHNFLVFPEFKLSFGWIAGGPFKTAMPLIAALAGQKTSSNATAKLRLPDWAADVELVTSRELAKRYCDFTVFAFVQHPLHRLVCCYRDLILGDGPLPAYFDQQRFSKDMPIAAFAARVASLPDLRTDNLIRSQASLLSHKHRLITDVLVDVDCPSVGLSRIAGRIGGRFVDMIAPINYSATHQMLLGELRRSGAEPLVLKRYSRDLDLLADRQNLISRRDAQTGRGLNLQSRPAIAD